VRCHFRSLLLLLTGCLAGAAFGQIPPEVFTLTAPQLGQEAAGKPFNLAVLTLALEKTRATDGDFRIALAPRMNTARALEAAKRKAYPNLLVLGTFQNQHVSAGLDYARFPVDLGLTGYRVCFVSPKVKAAVAAAETPQQLRAFSVGQGLGWADAEILRYNHFTVVDVPLKESLFSMVALGRVDLFCRGVDELESEFRSHRHIAGLDYDRSFVLTYKLPRVFLSHKDNGPALQRVTRGLLLAYRDGSFKALYAKYFDRAIRFAQLPGRRVVPLETPNIDGIDFDYQKYYLNPLAR